VSSGEYVREGWMKVRVVDGETVDRLVGMAEAIGAVREGLGALARGEALVPNRSHLEGEQGTLLVMPGRMDTGSGGGGGCPPALGAKLVSVFPGNPARGLPLVPGVLLLLDPETGLPLALLEAGYLTALRTGAASGVATDLLAREDASVLAVFGAGVQARTQVEAVRAVRDIREVRIRSRSRGSAERMAAELEGVEVRILEDPVAALEGAHVVVTATTSSVPVFPGEAVEPGAHVNGVGSFTPEMVEVDARLVLRSRVVVDSREGALTEAGDLIQPLRQGLITEEWIDATLGELVNGTAPSGRAGRELTFFKSVGHAVEDLAVGMLVLRRAEEEGAGTVVEL